ASGFDGGNLREIGRQFIGSEVLHIHFNQAHERRTKIRFGFAAAIDNHTDGADRSAVRADDVDRLLHPAAAGDDVFDHHEFFAVVDLESAPQSQFAIFFFGENVAFA